MNGWVVDEWMGGWMGGWVIRQRGGWVDGWRGRWVDGWMGGWVTLAIMNLPDKNSWAGLAMPQT